MVSLVTEPGGAPHFLLLQAEWSLLKEEWREGCGCLTPLHLLLWNGVLDPKLQWLRRNPSQEAAGSLSRGGWAQRHCGDSPEKTEARLKVKRRSLREDERQRVGGGAGRAGPGACADGAK